jgi:fibronectin-binding autotransporter adhesin
MKHKTLLPAIPASVRWFGSNTLSAGFAAFTLGAATLGVTQSALAANKIFNVGTANSTWNLAGNWNPNGVPTTGDNLLFNGTSAITTGLDAAFILGNSGSLSFDTGGSTINVNANTSGTTARTLTFGTSGTSALGNATTWIDTSSTTTGTINLGSAAGLGTLTIQLPTTTSTGAINVANASANLLFGVNSYFNAAPSSAPFNVINKTGLGTLTIAGTSTFANGAGGATLNVTAGTFTLASTAGGFGGQTTTLALNAASGTTSTVNLSNTASNGLGSLNVGTVSGGSGILNLTAGTWTLQGRGSNPSVVNFVIGGAGFGTLNMSGGSVADNGNLVVGSNGGTTAGGIMNMSAGTYGFQSRGTNTANPVVAIASVASSKGVLNLTGGTINTDPTSAGGFAGTVTNGFYVGENGAGVLNVSGSGNLVVGGLLNAPITGVTNNGLYVGGNTGSGAGSGVANLGTGGTITTSRVAKGNSGTSGIFNFHGGTLKAGSGIVNSTAFIGASSGTSNLTGVYVYNEGGTIDNNSQSITITQGLLAPTGSGASAISTTGLTTTGYTTAPLVSITGGGGTGMTANATIDGSGNLTGFTITNPGTGYTSAPTVTLIGGGLAANSSSTTAVTVSTNSTAGGIIFDGSGTTTLTGGNTYKGTTNVKAGTVVFGNSNGTSSIGNVTVADSATLGLKVTSTGTSNLTLGSSNLTLGSVGTSTLNFDFNTLANPTVPMITMTSGVLTLNGTPSFTFSNPSSLTNGVISLIDYGTLTGTFTGGSVTLGNRTSGVTSNDVGTSSIILTVSADRPVWMGADNGGAGSSNGNWNTTANNWKLQTAGTATSFITGDDVLFDDTATGTTTIDINVANVAPGTTTFNNSTKTYSITSSGGFGISSGAMIKNGSGTATISTNNTSTGTLTVNTGTLVLSGTNTFGSSSITGGVLQLGGGGTTGSLATGSSISIDSGASLAFNRSNAVTQGTDFSTAAISGLGSLIQNGTGILTLNAANTFSGGVTIKSGTVAGTNSATAFGSGTITIGDTAGSANSTLENSNGLNIANAITVASGNTGTASVVNNGTSTATFSGAATLNHDLAVSATSTGGITLTGNISGTGTLTNSSTGAGTVFLNTGTVTGSVALRQNSTMSVLDLQMANSATGGVFIDAGAILLHNVDAAIGSGNAVALGAVSGSADAEIRAANNSRTWSMGTLTVNSGSGARTITSYAGGVSGTFNPSSIVLNNNLTFQAQATFALGSASTATLAGAVTGTGNITLASYSTYSDTSSHLTLSGAQNQSGTITVANPQSYSPSYANNGAVTISGALGSGITNVIQNSATNVLNLNGTNTSFAGSLTINAGSVLLGNANALNANNTVSVGSGAILNLNGNSNTIAGLTGSGTVTNTATSAKTLTLGGSGTYSFDGTIADGATAGNMAVTKDGTGTMTLTNTNTYTGTTTVGGGTLVVNGSIADSAMTVQTTGVLTGTGTLGSSLTVKSTGVVNAGTVGTINTTASVTGATNFESGSIFSWDLSADGATGDKLTTGSVAGPITGDAIFRVVLADGTVNNGFFATSHTNFFADTNIISSVSDLTALFNTVQVYSALTNAAVDISTQGYFTLTSSGVSWSAVPEPTSALAGLLITAGLLRRRRA